jgi:hypothetical protein
MDMENSVSLRVRSLLNNEFHNKVTWINCGIPAGI